MSERESIYFLDGLALPETPPPGESPAPWGDTRHVGSPHPRIDGYERVSGTAVYASDVVLPGMLHAAILRSPHPHARLQGLDRDAALALPGVHDVIDASTSEADLAWPSSKEQPRKLFETEARFQGEAVAAVVADDPWRAREALQALAPRWEVLPAVVDALAALEPGAPQVHPGGNLRGEVQVYERGDAAAGLAEAPVVVERTFTTEAQLHTPLERHGCVARWDGPKLTLWHSTQGVFATQARVAQVMGLPLSRVRVVGPYMGGGFGSKLRPGKYAVIAALLARRTGRPVKLFLSREETLLAAGNRPATHLVVQAGAGRDGKLTALSLVVTASGGAWPAGATGGVDWQFRDLYAAANVRTERHDVFTHTGPSRPFRAPGHPQASFALEQVLDELAHRLGLDPVDLRLANIPDASYGRDEPRPYSTHGLAECLHQGAEAFGWAEARRRVDGQPVDAPLRRGVGVAACSWVAGAGGPPSTAILKLYADGSLHLALGASDIGTGTKTAVALVVAEELGIRPELVQIEHADTGTTAFATPSGGSKTIPTETPAVRDAAVGLKRRILELAAAQLEVEVGTLVLGEGRVTSTEDEALILDITELEGLQRQGELVVVGTRGPNPEDLATHPFGAHFAEVEVDVRTGEVKVLRLVAAHDSGRVMSRLTYDCQVAGGVVMGLGFGLMEARELNLSGTGRQVGRSWHHYRVPTALDSPPELVSLPIDAPDDQANTTGAKGLGEPVTIPTAAAVANAIHHATGCRIRATPMSPPALLAALNAKEDQP